MWCVNIRTTSELDKIEGVLRRSFKYRQTIFRNLWGIILNLMSYATYSVDNPKDGFGVITYCLSVQFLFDEMEVCPLHKSLKERSLVSWFVSA